jgi:signal transduction histidine kinase
VRRGFERRSVVMLAAVAMLAAVFFVMRRVSDPAPGIGVLAVLPVTLIGLELGLAGGLSAAALAASLLAINAAGGHPELGVLGVATRAIVFAAVGGVAGRFSDRMRRAYAREERLLRSGLELSGTIADDGLAAVVARAAARVRNVDGAHVHIDGLPPAVAGHVDGQQTAVAIAARGVTIGRIELTGRRRIGTEERAALELLATQSGLAADNRRLLARERERAGIEAELVHVRDELTEHRSGLGALLSSQEDERSRIAHLLHEDLAQILAAVLMGLRVLDREDPDRRGAAVEDLRVQVTDVLRELRGVAGALRPASLAQLGLRPALEALGADGRLDLDLDDAGPLPQAVETAVYRIVQDSLAGCGEAGRLGVRVESDAGGAAVELRLPAPGCRQAVLPAIRARAQAVSGETTLLGDGSIRVVVAGPRAAAV